MSHRFFLIFSLFAAVTMSSAADPLTTVFEHIDAAAKTFKGLTADISNTQYTAIVDDSDVQTGTIKLLRVKADVTRVLVDLKGARSAQTVALNGDQALIYNPKTKVEEVRDIGKYKDDVNKYMLLGFGSTSAAIKAAYDVSYVAEEKVGAVATSHLKLVPKSKGSLKQADLWFAENGLVAQQKFLQASGDYKLVTYSNIRLGAVSEKDLELKLPKGATIQHDQN